MKKIIWWILILAIIGLAVWGMAKLASMPKIDRSGIDGTIYNIEISEADWIKGNKEASAVLVEYSDFQCPACGAYYPLMKQITEDFGDKIAFVYRHFPLKQIHKHATLAAEAAEAAGQQGKFWEMHDLIFENQLTWSNKISSKDTFVEYAERLGLNAEKFKSDLESKEIKNKVESDYLSGISFGVNGTPTFFLNGKKLANPRAYDEFKQIIEQAISDNI